MLGIKVSCLCAGGEDDAKYHGYSTIDPLLCPICHKKYKSVGNVKVHMKDAHFSYGPYHCNMCPAVSRTKSGLRMHILRHHRPRLMPSGNMPEPVAIFDYNITL